MARRRRLEPPTEPDLSAIRAAAAADPQAGGARDLPNGPPIARIAADAVQAQQREIETLRTEARLLRRAAERLSEVEAAGLVIRDVPLDAIDVDYLARDRLPRLEEDDAGRALRQSIELHGQRMPLELAELGAGAERPFGLVSGYRRYAVLSRLARETGESRWRTARAVVRTPRTLGAAFVAMVEENEIRESLSYFERGQVCLRAAEQGAFATVDAALDALFQSASPAKRSKIRSFVLIAETLGDMLRRPETLGERLGLRIARAIRAGHGGALRRILAEPPSRPRDADDEQATLVAFLAALRSRRDPPPAERRTLDDGATLSLRRRGDRVVIEIVGATPSAPSAHEMLDALAGCLAGRRKPPL